MNKKILVSLALIGVAVAAIGGTVAFFSDKETSTGNTFIAGSIDLKVGDVTWTVNGPIDNRGDLKNWDPTDLTNQKFFDFSDLKPGDNGSDAIKIKVGTNPAWVCAKVTVTADEDNGMTEPEGDVDADAETGELDNALRIKFFRDVDCDGVQETGDDTVKKWTLFKEVGVLAIADAQHPTAIQPSEAGVCISKNWCFGEIDEETEACEGKNIGNESQTDKLVADLSFYAVQERHNTGFTCDQVTWTTPAVE